MSTRSWYALGACLALFLVLPISTAFADGGGAGEPFLSFGPLKAPHGYSFSGSAFGSGSGVSFGFIKAFNRGKVTESHNYTVIKGVKSKIAKNLRSASIKGKMGKSGSVALTFHPTGKAKKTKPPKGCTGKPGLLQAGTLTGHLKLITGSGFFKTFSASRIHATIEKFGKQTCTGTGLGNGTVKSLNGSFGKVSLTGTSFTTTSSYRARASTTTEQLNFNYIGAAGNNNLSVSHFISMSSVPSSALSIGADTAHVGAVSPLVSGSLDFKENCGSGAFTGKLTVNFDVVGTQTLDGPSGFGSLEPPPTTCNQPTGGGTPGGTPTPPVDNPPTASFSCEPTSTALQVQCTDSSSDDIGIASHSWTFGDGGTSTDANPTHTYGHEGTFTVTETVTDTGGHHSSTSQQVQATNQAPYAYFTWTCGAGTHEVDFDATSSSDSDGSIASYSWDFGDSSGAGSGATPTHTYASAGPFTVKLTVTDNDGKTANYQDTTVSC